MLHYILKHILWWKDRRLGHRRLSLGSTTQLSEGKTPQVSNQNYRLRHRNPSSLDQHACPPPLQEQIVQNAPYVVLVGCNHPRQANKQLYIELSWQHWSESCSFFVIFWCLASLATRSLTLHLWWIHKPLLIALILWVFLWFFVAVFSLSVQFSSVQFSQSCPTLCDPMNRSMPGLPVHHQLPQFTQTHAHRVDDAIQPSHPLLSPSPPAPNLSQHQGLFQWVSSSHEVAKVFEFQLQHQSFQWTPRTDLL